MSKESDNSSEDIDDLLDDIPNIRRKNVVGTFNLTNRNQTPGKNNSSNPIDGRGVQNFDDSLNSSGSKEE